MENSRTPLSVHLFAVASLLAGGLAAPAATATGLPEASDGKGWYFYRDPKELQKEESPPPPPPVTESKAPVAASDEPQLFSIKWFQKHLEKLQEDAMDNPDDEEKMKNYLYAWRVGLDKADNFSTKAMEMTKADPYLSYDNRVPAANFARNYLQHNSDKTRDKVINDLLMKGGLWFFFDSHCGYCQAQAVALETFKKQHAGTTVMNISLDGKSIPQIKQYRRNQGQFEMLGLRLTPALVYVMPPDRFLVIGQGAMSAEDMRQRLIANARAEKLIPTESEKDIFIFDRGQLTVDDLKELEKKGINPNDPGSWVKYLRDTLEGRY